MRTHQLPNGFWRAVGYDREAPDAHDTSYYAGGYTEAEAIEALRSELMRQRAEREARKVKGG